MRKVFLFMMISVDGYFEGLDHDLSWHNVDKEFSDFAIEQLNETDTIVFGHRTFELMESFWPTPAGQKADPRTAEAMNSLEKIVFSRSQIKSDWQNVIPYEGNVKSAMSSLKHKPGKSIIVLGSSNLCLTLLNAGLLDEIRLMVNPIALGKGTPLFEGLEKPVSLKTTGSRIFRNGNFLLTYDVVK